MGTSPCPIPGQWPTSTLTPDRNVLANSSAQGMHRCEGTCYLTSHAGASTGLFVFNMYSAAPRLSAVMRDLSLWHTDSLVVVPGLQSAQARSLRGLWDLSSPTRGRSCDFCIGRFLPPNHRESPRPLDFWFVSVFSLSICCVSHTTLMMNETHSPWPQGE